MIRARSRFGSAIMAGLVSYGLAANVGYTHSPFAIYFERNSAKISERGMQTLREIVPRIVECDRIVLVTGHADRGEDLAVSLARLNGVSSILAKLGVKSAVVRTFDRKDENVVTDRDDLKELNRRVEVYLTAC